MTFLLVTDAFAAGCAVLFGYRWLSADASATREKVLRYRRGTIGMVLWIALITTKLVLGISD
jgi:hypothetical protein